MGPGRGHGLDDLGATRELDNKYIVVDTGNSL